MPVGSPKAQTIASKKYQDKVGYISKSYKLKKDIVERFAEACEKNGWIAVSMKNDWKTIYGDEVTRK